MTLEGINPDDLPTPQTYTHVIAATGGRLIFVAGQEPEDSRGNLVGAGDLAAQARQVFANLGRAPAAAGARTDQVAKITTVPRALGTQVVSDVRRRRVSGGRSASARSSTSRWRERARPG
jgi:enamine deaminase RidA (YjgF/YER057c/UK114 family)